jgi:hypothetical protein
MMIDVDTPAGYAIATGLRGPDFHADRPAWDIIKEILTGPIRSLAGIRGNYVARQTPQQAQCQWEELPRGTRLNVMLLCRSTEAEHYLGHTKLALHALGPEGEAHWRWFNSMILES